LDTEKLEVFLDGLDDDDDGMEIPARLPLRLGLYDLFKR